MTGPKENSEFCFPKTLDVLRGTLRVEGKQNSLFPVGQVIKCFVTPPNSKIEQIIFRYHLMTLLQNVESFRLSMFSQHCGWPCQ